MKSKLGNHPGVIRKSAMSLGADQQRPPTATGTSPGPTSNLGIEHTKELHWRDWNCGDEIVKAVVLRNNTTEIIRLEYKLPKDRQFVVEYPKPLKLYPGISMSIQVTFVPRHCKDAVDKLIFATSAGLFAINLHAFSAPKRFFEVPTELNLGYMGVGYSSSSTFAMYNKSSIKMPFMWEAPHSITIVPAEGVLAPGEKGVCTVTCKPTQVQNMEVHSHVPHARVRASLTDTGLSKRGHLSLKEGHLDFGPAATSHVSSRKRPVTNNSPVPSPLCGSGH
eukprot:jgi/Botrbrau1/10952/Bobra.0383s0007.1